MSRLFMITTVNQNVKFRSILHSFGVFLLSLLNIVAHCLFSLAGSQGSGVVWYQLDKV